MTTTRRTKEKRLAKRTEEYLKAPYARVLLPERDGGYVAEILEFPGCIAQGDTAEEALMNLEGAAVGWIDAALEQGQQIPEPMDIGSFGGRVALRLPRSLHRKASMMAQRDGTSLNQFLVTAVAARVGAEDICDRVVKRYSSWKEPLSTPTTVFVSSETNLVFSVASERDTEIRSLTLSAIKGQAPQFIAGGLSEGADRA